MRKATGEARKFTTDLKGNYSAPFLPPGTYEVTFVAEGFASVVHTDVQVIISETTTLNVYLSPAGPAVDLVEIRAASLLQSDGPQQGRVVDSRSTSELPLATRNLT